MYRSLIVLAALFANATDIDRATASVQLDAKLPAWLIEIPGSVESVLIADAGNATLHRYMRSPQGVWQSDQRYMSIGQNGIRKQRAWDKRTPLGTYFVTERLDTRKLHAKYGVAAYPLDYPNAWDRINRRTGYGIWLHGVDKKNPKRPPFDTDGCLALPNNELLKIASNIAPGITPLIVAKNMRWAKTSEVEEIRLQLKIAIDQWLSSMNDGDFLTYQSLYDQQFSHRGMDRATWSSFRLQVFESRGDQNVQLHELLLLADPADEDIYLSRFRFNLAAAGESIVTTKRLYWRRYPNNEWKIVAEDAG